MREKLMKIIEDAFDENVSAWSSETCLGFEHGIEGKTEFLSNINAELAKLFDSCECDVMWEGETPIVMNLCERCKMVMWV